MYYFEKVNKQQIKILQFYNVESFFEVMDIVFITCSYGCRSCQILSFTSVTERVKTRQLKVNEYVLSFCYF